MGFLFCFVFLLSSFERRRRSLPSYTDPSPPAHHGSGQCSSLFPKEEDVRLTDQLKTGLLGLSEPGCSRVTRHKLPHRHAPSQLDHPSCCKSRADLKGCSSLFTQNTFLWLPVACPLHPVSFSLNERQKNYSYTLIRVISTILPDGTCARSQSALPSVLFLTVLGTAWR